MASYLPIVKKAVAASSPAPIIALYFAAAWCPDCVASKPHVSAVFRSQDGKEKVFDLVYVASDKDADQLNGELEDGWGSVPFDPPEDRASLKTHFGVCAQKELEGLGMTPEDRKGGIPTLILLEAATGRVLSTDAVPDIMGDDTKVEDPLGKWKSLLSQSS